MLSNHFFILNVEVLSLYFLVIPYCFFISEKITILKVGSPIVPLLNTDSEFIKKEIYSIIIGTYTHKKSPQSAYLGTL